MRVVALPLVALALFAGGFLAACGSGGKSEPARETVNTFTIDVRM